MDRMMADDLLQRVCIRVQDSMDEILTNFSGDAKITVLVRTPGKPTADFCMTSDDLDEVLAMVHRRKGDAAPAPQVAGLWSISSQGSWYVENTQAHSYTTVGISKDGNVKALAVSVGDNDEGDFIVAALNFYEKHLGQVEDKNDD